MEATIYQKFTYREFVSTQSALCAIFFFPQWWLVVEAPCPSRRSTMRAINVFLHGYITHTLHIAVSR